jgi:hypothetical protein
VDTLMRSSPQDFETSALATLADVHFGLGLATEREIRKYAKHSILTVVKRLRDEGLVELAKRANGGPQPGVWRWKPPQEQTLAELALACREQAHDGTQDDPF